MEPARRILALSAFALALAACGSGPGAADPVLKREPIRPASLAVPEVAPTTTTTAVLDPLGADHIAQTELRSVLAAAQEWYAENGTFDDGIGPVGAMSGETTVVSLSEVAARDGVAYDAHGSRLTLHRRSSSGTWFCIDIRGETTDHGFGDTFQDALAACTDGVPVGGWGNPVSATGPDEAAIGGVVRALFDALATGSIDAAYDLVSAGSACRPPDLEALWPAGLALADSADYQLSDISVFTDTATASVSSSVLPDSALSFEKSDGGWLLTIDPCLLFGPIAAEQMDPAARALLEEGLIAVRSAFVMQSDFAFGSTALAEMEPSLTFVPAAEIRFAALSYSGRPAEGLLITEGSPGRFYCAVESLSAVTVYGEGAAASELDTPARCRANAIG
ncbi:MAG: hypothetical protein KJO97_13755 [Acidimicrobiia bacterium]|nr:hypothetical protein [Acidimicrobiia bacterium]